MHAPTCAVHEVVRGQRFSLALFSVLLEGIDNDGGHKGKQR